MSKTKITETSSEENNKSVPTKSVKKEVDPIVSKIKQLDERGFDHNRIAAMLMCQKSLVKQILK
jgi:hypothetical protein